MRKVVIVGAGQSGLHLAHRLLDHGYDVTVVTASASTEIRKSAPELTQFSLPVALECERRTNLDFWSQAPRISGVRLGLYPPQADPMVISGTFAGYGQGYGSAVDRRIKMADWLEYFEDRGGKVVIHGATVTDLDHLARMFDLVVVAVGGGPLADYFARDPSRSSGAHNRVITQVLLDGVADSVDGPEVIEVVSAREGRVVLTPILTEHGPAHSLSVMGAPGQPSDGSALQPPRGHPDPDRVTTWIQQVLHHHGFVEVAARVAQARPTDAGAATITHLRPQVRIPVDTLPSGGLVVGLADVVVETDPLAGQGWNNSTLCAEVYAQGILDHGEAPFTREALEHLFETFWSATPQNQLLHRFAGVGQASATLSDLLHHMWEQELPEHLAQFLRAATTHQAAADRFVGPLADARDYAYLHTPEATRACLTEVTNQPT